MIEATTRRLAPLLVTALICRCRVRLQRRRGWRRDKAGGSEAPEVLRLAVADDAEQPDAPFARYFARRVSAAVGRLGAGARGLGRRRSEQPRL